MKIQHKCKLHTNSIMNMCNPLVYAAFAFCRRSSGVHVCICREYCFHFPTFQVHSIAIAAFYSLSLSLSIRPCLPFSFTWIRMAHAFPNSMRTNNKLCTKNLEPSKSVDFLCINCVIMFSYNKIEEKKKRRWNITLWTYVCMDVYVQVGFTINLSSDWPFSDCYLDLFGATDWN